MEQKQRLALFEKDIEALNRKSAINDANRNHIEGTHRYFCLAGEFDFIDMFLRPDTVAIDLGANEGQYSIKLAATCKRCVTVEPVDAIPNVAQQLPANCQLHKVAAGETPGTAIIHIPVVNGEQGYGGSSLLDLSYIEAFDGFVDQVVEIQTVDQIVAATCPDDAIGFIKIDVEGFEVPAIKGARRTIERWEPALLVEIWKDNVAEVTPFIEGMGYRGMFFFAGNLYDLSVYRPDIHTANENNWDPKHPEKFDGSRYVNNFFFIPIDKA